MSPTPAQRSQTPVRSGCLFGLRGTEISAIAFRLRPKASTITSRYDSHALALGARSGCDGAAGSVHTSVLVGGLVAQSRWTFPEMLVFTHPRGCRPL